LYSSNAAATTGDSARVLYTSNCGNSNWKTLKLTNTLLAAPLAPASITITEISVDKCLSRRYLYTAPSLPLATATTGPASGYFWSMPTGVGGVMGVLDSGSLNGKTVVFSYLTTNAGSDSIKLNYLSGCGNSFKKSQSLTGLTKICPITKNPISFDKEETSNIVQLEEVSIIPNPTNSYFRILIPSGPRSISVDLEIIDMQGRILERKSSVKTNESVHCGMTLRPGVYILKLHHGKIQKSYRIVKH
jgi:hypothetical protein